MPGVPAGDHYDGWDAGHGGGPAAMSRPAFGVGPGDLPYMGERELEEFIAQNPELHLSGEEVLYLRLRRRRLSVQRMRQVGADPQSDPLPIKLVAVGDESVRAKQRSLQLFLLQHQTEDAPSLAGSTPCAIGQRSVTFTSPQSPPQACTVEVWVPPCGESHRMLRRLYYSGVSAFLVYFSVTDRRSFDNVRSLWLCEVQGHLMQNTDIPVVVIGTDAEARHGASPAQDLVSSEEAVALAQEFGASKYIEVFSNNIHHANEVAQQTLRALSGTRHWGALQHPPPPAQAQEALLFRQHLRPPTPRGRFDLMSRTFTVDTEADTQYYVTFDGEDPTLCDAELTGPIKLKQPYPQRILVRAFRRCMFPSETLIMPVPQESDPPKGYFDVCRRGFFVHHPPPASGARVHYALDGAKPTQGSPVVGLSEGLLFDSEPPCHATGSSCDGIPESITVVAVEDGKFRSRAVTYQAPPMLAPPKVSFSEGDRVLRVLSPQPNVEYRYTLNGATPSYTNSSVLSNAVMLPADLSVHRIRVAAFPRLALPSRVVDVVIGGGGGHHHHHHQHPQHHHHQQQQQHAHGVHTSREVSCHNSSLGGGGGMRGAEVGGGGGGGGVSTAPHVAMTKSARGRIKASQEKRSASAAAAAAQQALTRHRTPSPKRVPAVGSGGARLRSGSLSVASAASARGGVSARGGDGGDAANVTCATRSSSLDFAFDDPIAITHITVATPGGGRGPSGYRIVLTPPPGAGSPVAAGTGHLQDANGVQIMNVDPEFRFFQTAKVEVHFTKPQAALFRINNVQIHGKPALQCP